MTKKSGSEAQEKRDNIQRHFWGIVGSLEHINIPKLEDAICREFHKSDDRFVEEQVKLMQTEGRIKVQDKVKVWIKQPSDEVL